ncbi:hypothetical protein [Streptomyces sp. B93]|uniref:hypothetical protein n=1 Tax=Streptomyces sp. B93 TaxID=2824875 RepID=UPI001FFC35AE|nr:hypothetical protein [Streptomyces sp. B93]
MLTYQDVVTVRIGVLTTAATHWDDMAKGFEDLETLYAAQVLSVARKGRWVGVSATAADEQLSATRGQLKDAQTEARAIASLLRDAHQQFAELIGRVRSLVEQAKAEKFTVTSQGVAVYDADSVQAMRHDPDFQKYEAQVKIAEAAWTKQIKDAVRAVDDADQGVKLALHQAAGVRSWFDRLRDPLGRDHTFNGSAVGDVEVYEAREAEKYTDRILGGEKLDGTELAEWERLMRDNSGDEVFSRTVLDHVGPEGTIRLTNQLNDLAYDSDEGNRQRYLAVEKGFATAVATATRDPDSAFYRECREGLREAGARRYEWQGRKSRGTSPSSPSCSTAAVTRTGSCTTSATT